MGLILINRSIELQNNINNIHIPASPTGATHHRYRPSQSGNHRHNHTPLRGLGYGSVLPRAKARGSLIISVPPGRTSIAAPTPHPTPRTGLSAIARDEPTTNPRILHSPHSEGRSRN
ncbi:MAG: hypothetical protein NC117_08835 [Pseudoflavonifractor sp.]|nr:hypothetical protein [Pseudoflavonifractor sp.]